MAGILHTIVFHRALGLIRPKDIDLELFEITYVSIQYLLFSFMALLYLIKRSYEFTLCNYALILIFFGVFFSFSPVCHRYNVVK